MVKLSYKINAKQSCLIGQFNVPFQPNVAISISVKTPCSNIVSGGFNDRLWSQVRANLQFFFMYLLFWPFNLVLLLTIISARTYILIPLFISSSLYHNHNTETKVKKYFFHLHHITKCNEPKDKRTKDLQTKS